MRRRSDLNQTEIIGALREHGVSVVCLSGVGGGVPDILTGFNGRNDLLEVKNGRGALLTDDEERFLNTWQGECHVVFSAEQAMSILGLKAGEDEQNR